MLHLWTNSKHFALTLLLSVIFCFTMSSQSLPTFIDKDNHLIERPLLGARIHAIHTHNYLVQKVGKLDTIDVRKSGNDYRFFYSNEDVTDELFNDTWTTTPVIIKFAHDGQVTRHCSKIGKAEDQFYKISLHKNSTCDGMLEYTQMENGLKSGQYFSACLNGKQKTSGNYELIDSTFYDTSIVFNPNTFTETITITTRNQGSRRCGAWQIIDSDESVRIEQYSACN